MAVGAQELGTGGDGWSSGRFTFSMVGFFVFRNMEHGFKVVFFFF